MPQTFCLLVIDFQYFMLYSELNCITINAMKKSLDRVHSAFSPTVLFYSPIFSLPSSKYPPHPHVLRFAKKKHNINYSLRPFVRKFFRSFAYYFMLLLPFLYGRKTKFFILKFFNLLPIYLAFFQIFPLNCSLHTVNVAFTFLLLYNNGVWSATATISEFHIDRFFQPRNYVFRSRIST